MSDGPHRSLPMRRHWKELAERAAKAAFSSDEVCEALPVAIKRDFFAEAPLETVREILGGGKQASLFSDDRAEQLDAARQASRSAVGTILIDCAIEAVADGLAGEAAFRSALASALEQHTRGEFRSIEEHYQAKASAYSARYLRDRLDAARQRIDFKGLSGEIATKGKQPLSKVHLAKRRGLDEGPPL